MTNIFGEDFKQPNGGCPSVIGNHKKKKKSKWGKNKLEMQSKEEKDIGKFNTGAKSCAEGDGEPNPGQGPTQLNSSS